MNFNVTENELKKEKLFVAYEYGDGVSPLKIYYITKQETVVDEFDGRFTNYYFIDDDGDENSFSYSHNDEMYLGFDFAFFENESQALIEVISKMDDGKKANTKLCRTLIEIYNLIGF